jgi:hypothetical protein
MDGSSSRTTCKPLLQELETLTLPSKYTFSLSTYWKLAIYEFNSSVHGINMKHKLKLHKPSTKHTMYQKGVYYSSIKIHYTPLAELVSDKKFF